MSVALADAIDIDAATIRPRLELKDSNHALGNPDLMNRMYEDQGYLLLRQVLDHGAVRRALKRMMAVMARHGVVEADAEEPVWTGKPGPGGMEESKEFSGICRELVEDPANLAFFERLLGERPASVPIVQYRSYAPHTPLATVHQDGFFSPGIQGFRPVWIPLTRITPDMGSLMLVPGGHRQGLLHNLAKPPTFPIPDHLVPAEGWATTTFEPGDVLVIHPHIPHVGGANTSNRVRFSIDTRIQSAAHPCVLLGDVVGTTPDSVTIRTETGDRTLKVSDRTYVRTGENRGARVTLDRFQAETPEGLRVVAALEGDEATMLRRASEG